MSTTGTGSTLISLSARTDETVIKKWELGVSCIMHLWDALSAAVANQWGGPESSGKRDWLSGEIADMYTNAKVDELSGVEEADEYDVEEVLGQVMQDEFLTAVEDGSLEMVARQIQMLRVQVLRYDFSGVEEVYRRWSERKDGVRVTQVREEGEEWEGDSDKSGVGQDDNVNVDMEMGDVSGEGVSECRQSGRQKPVVDDEGFQLVQSRRR